jgi:hypothetical protein
VCMCSRVRVCVFAHKRAYVCLVRDRSIECALSESLSNDLRELFYVIFCWGVGIGKYKSLFTSTYFFFIAVA